VSQSCGPYLAGRRTIHKYLSTQWNWAEAASMRGFDFVAGGSNDELRAALT